MFTSRAGWESLADEASTLSPWSVAGCRGCPVQAKDVESRAHPLSNAAITAAIPINIHGHRWPFPATAAVVDLAILTQAFLSNIPTLSLYTLLQEMVLSRALHCLIVAVLPLQFNPSPLVGLEPTPHSGPLPLLLTFPAA